MLGQKKRNARKEEERWERRIETLGKKNRNVRKEKRNARKEEEER